MTLDKLAQLVKEMRDAQRNYFKTLDTAILEHAKRCEKTVDRTVEHILAEKSGELFSDSEQ